MPKLSTYWAIKFVYFPIQFIALVKLYKSCIIYIRSEINNLINLIAWIVVIFLLLIICCPVLLVYSCFCHICFLSTKAKFISSPPALPCDKTLATWYLSPLLLPCLVTTHLLPGIYHQNPPLWVFAMIQNIFSQQMLATFWWTCLLSW